MDTQDDKPERSAPEDGKGVPPGWYPDPAGGWGLRWWTGARWTEHTAVAQQTVKRKWTWSLANVFQVELGLAAVGVYISVFSIFSSDACGGSDRCYRLVSQVWLSLVAVQAVLVAVCAVAFWRSKWIAVKLAAAVMLPIGMVATWVVADRMITKALNM
jgi:hypothetical protein